MKLDTLPFSLSTLMKAMLAVGVLQVAAYYFCGTMASPDRHIAVPQPDTLLYCQSARMICEGQPFVFSPGDKPSTGCTSHLYPFILAVPYALGAKGDALLTAGFALNALFYLVFLACWGVSIFKLCGAENGTEEDGGWKRGSTLTALVACALIAFFGETAYVAMAQSDMGCFMALSAALFAALLWNRMVWFGILLTFSPWSRPEGFIFSGIFFGALIFRRLFCGKQIRPGRGEWLIAGLALLSCACVFVFNGWLTGMAQFQSVVHKGYFKQMPFASAIVLSARDALVMFKAYFFGSSQAMPRDLYFLPLLSAVFGWMGVFTRSWKNAWKETGWCFAVVAAVAVVASSSWQNTNMDRYIAWIFPIWFLFIAEGVVWLSKKLPENSCRFLPAALLLIFQAMGAIGVLSMFSYNSTASEREYDLSKEVDKMIPAKAVLGGIDNTVAYAFPGHRFNNLGGLYSPDFLSPVPLTNLELLKHEPDKRFDIWHFDGKNKGRFWDISVAPLLGETFAVGVDDSCFRAARWAALDNGLLPLHPPKEKKLVDRVDVGYLADEKRSDYQAECRFYGAEYQLFGMEAKQGTNVVMEVGRPVMGWDSMTLSVTPGQEAVVILRTTSFLQAMVMTFNNTERTLSFDSPLRLRAKVDGKDVGEFSRPIVTGSNVFSEIAFVLPSRFLQRKNPRLEIFGDHAALAYWIYQ